MARTKAGGWIAGAIVLMLAITAATWFLAAQPRFADAGATTAQAQDVRDQNDLLQQKIVKLKADFAKLDEYRAQLAEIQTQIPAEAMLTDYARSLQGAADASGVTLLDINPGTAVQVVVPVVAAPPAPTPTPTDSGTAAAEPTSQPTAQPDGSAATGSAAVSAASTVPDGFAAIPMTFRVVGTYDQVRTFLGTVQTQLPRLFLISGLDGSAQQAAPASGGRPATVAGDLELAVTGYLWALPATSVAGDSTTVDGSGDQTPPQLPSGTKNPFAPLG